MVSTLEGVDELFALQWFLHWKVLMNSIFGHLQVTLIHLSLSTVVLNSRDWWKILWFPKNFAL